LKLEELNKKLKEVNEKIESELIEFNFLKSKITNIETILVGLKKERDELKQLIKEKSMI